MQNKMKSILTASEHATSEKTPQPSTPKHVGGETRTMPIKPWPRKKPQPDIEKK